MVAERRVLHVLPHPGGGGEEYTRLLGALEGFAFERTYLSRGMSPLRAAAALAVCSSGVPSGMSTMT